MGIASNLSPLRLAKRLGRGCRVLWREEPTQHDIEALDANIRRVGLVIRVRWALVVVLVLFSVAAAAVYTSTIPLEDLRSNMTVPAAALVFVLVYNTFYSITYTRFGNVAVLNHAQLLFDVLVVAVLIHYSGGVYSWFHAMFLLFILEAAFILPQGRDIWIVAGFAALIYVGILALEYFGVLDPVAMPFVSNDLHTEAPYVAVRGLWAVTMMAGTAVIGTLMMNAIRSRESAMAERSMIDGCTMLYNRSYFRDALETEVARAAHAGGSVGVVLMDIHRFGRFNRMFGFREGNRMLAALARELREALKEQGDAESELDVLCRFGGEEFAMVVPELSDEHDEEAFEGRLVSLAEAFRRRAERFSLGGKTVTLSLGVAAYPGDGATADGLLSAADRALAAASESGGNRVVTAGSLDREPEAAAS